MKKISLLLSILATPYIYACVPQSYPLPEFAKTKLEFKGDFSSSDSVEVTVKDTNCVSDRPCKTEKFTFNPSSGNNTINVIPGSKSITVVQLKDGKVIGQSTYDQTVLLDKSVIISVNPTPLQTPGIVSSPVESSTSTATPLSSPTIFPSDNGNSSNNNTPSPTITFTPSPTITFTPTPIDTPIPTSTSTNYFPSHGGGGAVNPTIQVSATVNPDNTGVK